MARSPHPRSVCPPGAAPNPTSAAQIPRGPTRNAPNTTSSTPSSKKSDSDAQDSDESDAEQRAGKQPVDDAPHKRLLSWKTVPWSISLFFQAYRLFRLAAIGRSLYFPASCLLAAPSSRCYARGTIHDSCAPATSLRFALPPTRSVLLWPCWKAGLIAPALNSRRARRTSPRWSPSYASASRWSGAGAARTPSPNIARATSCSPASASDALRPRHALPGVQPAGRLGDVRRRGALGGHRHRHRRGRGPGVRDRRQRRDGQGRHLLPHHRQEAPARAGDRRAERPALHLPGGLRRRLPAAPGRRLPRPRPLRAHLLQPGADVGQAHPADRGGDGLLHGGRRLRPGDERRDRHRARQRHDLPGRAAAGEGRHRRGGQRRGAGRRRRAYAASPASPTTTR